MSKFCETNYVYLSVPHSRKYNCKLFLFKVDLSITQQHLWKRFLKIIVIFEITRFTFTINITCGNAVVHSICFTRQCLLKNWIFYFFMKSNNSIYSRRQSFLKPNLYRQEKKKAWSISGLLDSEKGEVGWIRRWRPNMYAIM